MLKMKKNVKRLLAALMSVAMLSAVLGGCGSKTGGETSAGSSSASAGEPMTVRISAGPSGANNFMIAFFNAISKKYNSWCPGNIGNII